jgi:hypothetical protein
MNTLGFSVPPKIPDSWDMSDLILLSVDLRGWVRGDSDVPYGSANTSPWISQDRPVPVWQIVAGSVRLNRPVETIAERFDQLGLQIPTLNFAYSPVG